MAIGRAAGLVAALLAAGCAGKDTAILLEVTAGSGTPAVDRLEFVIGVEIAVPGHDPIFVKDSASSIAVTVTGRDLGRDPYRLLVHDGVAGGTAITGAVLGYTATGSTPVAFAGLAPLSFISDEILLLRLELASPSAAQVTATGCVTWQDGGQRYAIGSPTDQDCDGVPVPEDCNDLDPNVRPGIDEVCGNGIDDNCNGQIDESPDADGDGWHLCAGDCDDHDPTVHPGAVEVCDGKDNDCNGKCDDGFDADGDGYTTCGTKILAGGKCQTGVVPDCNDNDATIHPGATEVCDGKDNDCNGVCDDGLDPDGDGFTTCGTLAGLAPIQGVCGAPTAPLVDCREGTGALARAVHPFAHEICDGVLDNCDGRPETVELCYRNSQQQCTVGQRACDDTPGGGLAATCDPASDPMLDVPIDPALCAAYAGPCAADPDPWRCANQIGAAAVFDCGLAWRRVPGSPTRPPGAILCAPASTPAPQLGLTAGCQFILVGGTVQEGYQVGFLPRNGTGTPAAFLDDCSGDVVAVAATNAYAPQPDQWLILASDTGHMRRSAALLRVTPLLVTSCPATALSCTMHMP